MSSSSFSSSSSPPRRGRELQRCALQCCWLGCRCRGDGVVDGVGCSSLLLTHMNELTI